MTPKPPAPYDPRGAHLRRQPRGLCYGCGAGSHETRLLYIDGRGLDWHAECYRLVMQQPLPSGWRTGRRLLRFQR